MAIEREGAVSYVGRVVRVTRREERVMSDIYADVWRARVVKDDGSTEDVWVNSNFELDTRRGKATADLAPEWARLMEAYDAKRAAEGRLATAEKVAKDAERGVPPRYPEPRKGDLVMVTGKAKGLPEKGTFAEVVWTGTSKFSGAARVGILVNGEKVYCPASKVTRAATSEELEAADEVAAEATAKWREKAARELEAATMAVAEATAEYEAARAATATEKAA